jgi:hypothetical protein
MPAPLLTATGLIIAGIVFVVLFVLLNVALWVSLVAAAAALLITAMVGGGTTSSSRRGTVAH